MAVIIDIGLRSRQGVAETMNVLIRKLKGSEHSLESNLLVLGNPNVLGGEFSRYNGSLQGLIHEFGDSQMAGFRVGLSKGSFISVWPPKHLNSQLDLWRVIAETDTEPKDEFLSKLISVSDVVYAAISQDEMLDLETLDHVDTNNFPWNDWRLIAARVN